MSHLRFPYNNNRTNKRLYPSTGRNEHVVRKLFYLSALLLVLFLMSSVLLSKFTSPPAQESITFFPINPQVKFKSEKTSLKLAENKAVIWRIESSLDQKAYLRQDAGFLYVNGRLTGKLGDWKQNTDRIIQERDIPVSQDALFQAISFHHAELHEKDGQIYSAQAISGDQLYVGKENSHTFTSFRTAKSSTEKQLKQKLNEQTQRMLRYSWNKAIRHFSIPLEKYQAYPLNEFNQKTKDQLPNFTKEASAKVIGQLWEGLYKNYFLGIKKQDGTAIDPIGSPIPLILVSADQTHLLVVTETADGEPIVLRQRIEGNR